MGVGLVLGIGIRSKQMYRIVYVCLFSLTFDVDIDIELLTYVRSLVFVWV